MLKSIIENVQTMVGGRSARPPRCIAVCIDHQTRMWSGVGPGDIEFLVDRLTGALSTKAVSYVGQEDHNGETRLYFSTSTPGHALPVVLAELTKVSWCRGSHVLVQSRRFGFWRTHLL